MKNQKNKVVYRNNPQLYRNFTLLRSLILPAATPENRGGRGEEPQESILHSLEVLFIAFTTNGFSHYYCFSYHLHLLFGQTTYIFLTG